MNILDQFYTRPDLAAKYAAEVIARWAGRDALFVEPAAGEGAFFRALKQAGCKARAIDIAPRSAGIKRGDFLQSDGLFKGEHVEIVVVGNPPFGKNAAMAVKFFNHAAIWADEISFIVPRTFRKMSLQARLNRCFHLFHDEDVPPNAFLLNGLPHDVPCAWQTWTRRKILRVPPRIPSVNHLIDYTTPRLADFAMRRVGFYAGRIVTKNILALSQTTHYFMREMQAGVKETLRDIEWRDIAAQTAGVRSLSKREIAIRLSGAYHV